MKLKFPVAKIRKEDGVPAVWLTFTNWLILERGIVREYLYNREERGRVLARRELKVPVVCDGAGFEVGYAENSIELYRVGWQAHNKVYARSDTAGLHCTPDKLIAAGDRAEKRGYEEETKKQLAGTVAGAPRELAA